MMITYLRRREVSKITPEFWSNAAPFAGMIKETDFMAFFVCVVQGWERV